MEDEGTVQVSLSEIYDKGYKAGVKEVVEWMEQERQRHAGQHLGKPFKEVLAHYFQHKDISLDK